MKSQLLAALLPLLIVSSCHAAPIPKASSTKAQAPIPISFTLQQRGFVTLVIEGMSGKRVRNLISETPFEAGDHTVYWDGLDDSIRDSEAAERGVYRVSGNLVAAGNYRVRGLVRPEIELRYALTPYTNGQPPWQSSDASSGWLANHSAPSSTLFLPGKNGEKPQIMVGSPLSEGGSALAWLDLNGKKLSGVGHVGGIFSGAATLARDSGKQAVPGVDAYSATGWEGELRLYAWSGRVAKPVLTPSYGERDLKLRGLAVHNGLVAASLGEKLLFVDASSTTQLGTLAVPDARGVAFDSGGRLLILSGSQLVRYTLPADIKPFLKAPAFYGEPLSMNGWTARASSTAEHRARVEWAFDGDLKTRWASGQSQKPGDYFIVDMKAPRTFSGLLLDSSGHQDHPAGWEVQVSNDGASWSEPVASSANEKPGEFNSAIAGTAGGVAQTRASFAPQTARYLKVTLTKPLGWWWAINDLTVYNGARASTKATQQLPAPEVLTRNLENAQVVFVDERNSIYVSDWGNSHQVKVFDECGKPIRSLGKAGAPRAGIYDANRMNHPSGMTIAPGLAGEAPRLWVAESDLQPKRVSVWDTQSGKLVRAFYGPGRYGGGGSLDPNDRTKFYYDGMEFKLDWTSGESVPVNVFLRPDTNSLPLPDGYGASGTPETAIYLNNRRYLTNAFNSNPTHGAPIATIWMMRDGVARPVAALGKTADWKVLHSDEFTARPDGDSMFVWSDENADAQMQPAEVQFWRAKGGSVTVGRDLSFVASRVDERAVRWKPTRFTSAGIPIYDSKPGETLATGTQPSPSSGGDQVLVANDGWSVLTTAPKPLSAYGIGGAKSGQTLWSYPSLWPGLHASHRAPTASFPGQLLGTTRLLGNTIQTKAGEIWGINGNKGQVYLFTTDGLFVATLFKDARATGWNFPTAKMGMRVDEASLQEEAFWTTMTQTSDEIYLQAGFFGNIVRVDGLEKIQRLPSSTLQVTPQLLAQARQWNGKEARGVASSTKEEPLVVSIRAGAPVIDAKMDEWNDANFVSIDDRTRAALAVSGGRLFAAFQTGDAKLLQNAGESTALLFKGGGALDLQLATREGGMRLLVAQVNGKTRATLYRPRVPGTTTAKVKFSSPNRTISFDRVDDVSAQITLKGDGKGFYEMSFPLSLLEWKAEAGTIVRGDIGVLRGNGFQTLQRVYWRNKASGLVSDVPSEAELSPHLWGDWKLE